MAIRKNPGPPLRSIFKGLTDVVPPRWRAKLGLKRTVQKQPIDVEPKLNGERLIIASSVEQDLTDERKKTDVRIGDPSKETMSEKVLLKDGRTATKEIKYVPEGTKLPESGSKTIDADQQASGNGFSEQVITTAEVTFPGPVYSKSIENLIPPKFRAQIPTATSEITQDGVANPNPTLAVGELTHEEQQINVNEIRVKSVNFGAITPPVEFTDTETDETYGGSVLDVIMTLHTVGSLTVDTGLLVVKSEVTNLGNGYEIRTTRRAQGSSWTELEGQEYDERLDVVLPFTRQVKDAGAGVGTPRTDIKPIDRWREESQTVDLTAAAAILDAYVLVYEGRVNIDLPDKLVSITGILENATGEGANSETGTFAFTGNYSVSMSLRASAQSSANILPDTVVVIKQFWGNNIKCANLHFFLPSPILGTTLIDKINALVAPNVVANWPKYNPEMVTLQGIGQRVSLQVTASSQGSASVSGTGTSSTAGGGTGSSREVGITLKAIRISPTIHAEINVDGSTDDTQNISATATAEATGLGPSETITQSASVEGSITPTTIPATAGDVDWPTVGLFLYHVDAQPYRFGYIQFHVVIVNAADFPSNV